MEIKELGDSLDKYFGGMDVWRAKQEKRFDDIEQELKAASLQAGRQSLFGGTAQKTLPTYFDTKTRQRVPVLGRDDSLAALESKAGGSLTGQSGETPSLGRVLRGIVLGGHAHDARELEDERKSLSIGTDPSGGFTVGGILASKWIDQLRSQMALAQAGVTTVPMDGNSLTLAKLNGDPTVEWHGENQALTDSEPMLGAVTLRAKTATCLVKLSLELSQDSANIEDILQRSITSAMAHAIDEAGLVGVTENAGAAPMTGAGIFNLAGRNTVTGIGAPASWDWCVDSMYELLAANVPMESIGAMIAHPALWKRMRKLKTGIASDNTPLTMPDEVAKLRKLWTTAAPLTGGTTAKAVMGNWSDLLFGVRKNITLQVLNQAFMGSNLQIAVLAYARCDFVATRAQSFVTAEGITV